MPSANLTIFKWIGIVAIVGLLANNFTMTDASYTSSMIAPYDIEVATNEAQAHLEMASLLRSKTESAIKPVKDIINKLTRSDKTACDVQAELRLVGVSRSFEGSASGDLQSLDAIKVLYGIRKAICETDTPRSRIPTSCQGLVVDTGFDGTRKAVIHKEIELAHSSVVPICLKKLQEHHFFWTSYSNNLQDAGDIVHMIRSDIEMHGMILNYREFETIMLDYLDLFDTMRMNNTAWWAKAERNVWRFIDLQDRMMQSFSESFDMRTSTALQNLEEIGVVLAEQRTLMHKAMSQTFENLVNVTKKTSSITQDLDLVKSSIANVFSSATLEVVDFIELLKLAVEGLYQTAASDHDALVADIKVANNYLTDVSLHVLELFEIHKTNLAVANEHHEVASRALTMQQNSAISLQRTVDLVETLLVDTQDLGNTVSTVTYLVMIIKEYEQIAIAICVFIAISIVLAPFEGILVSQKVVSHIKAAYWFVQATMFLVCKLDFIGGVQFLKRSLQQSSIDPMMQLVFWFMVSIGTICLLIIVHACFTEKRPIPMSFDVEKVQMAKREEHAGARHICNSQRQRIESFPRSVRHGTAPPGL